MITLSLAGDFSNHLYRNKLRLLGSRGGHWGGCGLGIGLGRNGGEGGEQWVGRP